MAGPTSIERYAIERVCQDPDAVSPMFQPVVDLERQGIWGYELLASIQGPLEAATPVWFAAAAEYGLEGALEARIVRSGLSSAAQVPGDQTISINVTPRALRAPQLQAAFRAQERFDAIVLEIDESQLGEEDVPATLEAFRAGGGKLAVDGLAAGPTRLRRLVELRPDVLKLDRSLVAGIDADPSKQLAAEFVVLMGARLQASVVAVGLERQEELEAIRNLGIHLAQGFLFGPRYATLADAQERVRVTPS